MTSYIKTTDFLAKDSLPLNNAAKYVKGSEIDTEFTNLASADLDNMKKSSMGTGVESALGVDIGTTGAPMLEGTQGDHGSAAKGWAQFGVTGNILDSYNVASVTDTGTGVATVVWDVDFASANYSVSAMCVQAISSAATCGVVHITSTGSQLVGSAQIRLAKVTDGTLIDPTNWMVVAFGDQ